MKALLKEAALTRLPHGPFRFCSDPTCDVVYFDEAANVFTIHDIRVVVWQKAPAGVRVICYCFDENESAIAREVAEAGSSGAIGRVRDHIAANRCACEVRNPRGVCCLGDLTQAVERITAEYTKLSGSR